MNLGGCPRLSLDYRLILFFSSATAHAFFPEKKIYTEIIIQAPVGAVWAVLIDNAAYSEWNSYHVKVERVLEPGGKLALEIHKPNGETVEIEPHVMRLEPSKELTWGGGIKGIFHGEHVFLLEKVNASTTKLIHKERFHGLAIPFASLDAVEEGYQLMDEALKRRVEEKVGN